jgi:hypothetical protein
VRKIAQSAVIAVMCLGVVVHVHGRNPNLNGRFQQETRAPEGPLQAAQWGARDAEAFKKRHPAGIWSGFLFANKPVVNEWPAHVKRAYLESARSVMEKAPRVKTLRGEKPSEPVWGR